MFEFFSKIFKSGKSNENDKKAFYDRVAVLLEYRKKQAMDVININDLEIELQKFQDSGLWESCLTQKKLPIRVLAIISILYHQYAELYQEAFTEKDREKKIYYKRLFYEMDKYYKFEILEEE